MSQANTLLLKAALRQTAIRAATLDLFLASPYALTHSHLEERLRGEYDRVTIYRTLKTFEEKGIIHRVADDSDSIRYALCNEAHCHHDHKHADHHVHFKCERCGNTFCLDHVEVPHVNLPKGYTANDFQFLVIGVCKNC